MQNHENILLKSNCVEILSQKSRFCLSLKCTCLIKSICRSYCCSCNTSKWCSRLWERSLQTQSYSIFIHYTFDNLCAQVGSKTITHLNWFILGLGAYFVPVNVLSNKKRDVPRNVESARIKSEILLWLYDGY